MIQRLKAFKKVKHLNVEQVWDTQTSTYVQDEIAMAEVFIQVAQERQGNPRGDAEAGQQLLDLWSADFSACRTRLPINEIHTIIRDGPRGKRPGPDGVPAEVFQRYAHQLAPIFHEAWEELMSDGTFSNEMYRVLALKMWVVVPKFEGANRTEKFRDLEIGNESRKTLARMLTKVVDEVCSSLSTGLSQYQQAFMSGRDIVNNTFTMLKTFWDAVEEGDRDGNPLLALLLDCSKGYNFMSREWITRVLVQASVSGNHFR